MYNVVIVDDHKLFREGLKMLLNQTSDITVIADFVSGKEFVENATKLENATVLMDIEMPDMNGIEATRKGLIANPQLKIIALSMFSDMDYYYSMIEAGVKGFLIKNTEINELINAVKSVADGGNFFSDVLLVDIIKNIQNIEQIHNFPDHLSKREIEIIQLICNGLSNQEIGDKLFISKRTVDKHRANILDKTGAKNTAALVMYAMKKGIIKP